MNPQNIPQNDGSIGRQKRGEVNFLNEGSFGNISQQWSRPLNQVEGSARIAEIEQEAHEKISAIREEQAYQTWAFYMELVAEHNTKNHKITIDCAMGSCTIKVDGKSLDKFFGWHKPGICLLLEEIEQSMDWDWAHHLNGFNLN